MKKLVLSIISLVTFISLAIAADKVTYKYKKYEKFDFEELSLEGDLGNPGDLSILPRYRQRYKNKLPYRKNFNSEIRKSVGKIR